MNRYYDSDGDEIPELEEATEPQTQQPSSANDTKKTAITSDSSAICLVKKHQEVADKFDEDVLRCLGDPEDAANFIQVVGSSAGRNYATPPRLQQLANDP
jgi:hypothetical protein